MKTLATKLIGRNATGVDGEIGTVQDLYFDDERWVIRYLVVATGEWLSQRPVLVSPLSISEIGEEDSALSVNLTQAILATSPDVSSRQPVSRRFEIEYSKHFEYPIYWAGGGLWGGAMNPVVFAKNSLTEEEEREALAEKSDQSHLRSVIEVSGYHIEASNGSVGHIEDFLIDSESWKLVDIVVDTRNWFPGKKVLVDPAKITEILWSESIVHVDMDKEGIRESPEFG